MVELKSAVQPVVESFRDNNIVELVAGGGGVINEKFSATVELGSPVRPR